MRIILIGEMSGTRDGQDWPPRGSTVDLPDDEAVALLHGGMAKPADDPVVVEEAVPLTTDVAAAVVPTRRTRTRREG